MNTNHNLTVAIIAALLAISGLIVFCTGCQSANAVLLQKGQKAPYPGYLIPVPGSIPITPAQDKGGK